MSDWWHFRVVAHLTNGRAIVSGNPLESMAASSAESVARKWYWLLDPSDRALVDRVIVFSPDRRIGNADPYPGPTVVFRPIAGKMVETERR